MRIRKDSIEKKTCKRCGYVWLARVEQPRQCPRCKRVDWAVAQRSEKPTEKKA